MTLKAKIRVRSGGMQVFSDIPPSVTVDGYAYSDTWAVCKSPDPGEHHTYKRGNGAWSVIHRPTGLTACMVQTKRDAKRVADALVEANALPDGVWGEVPRKVDSFAEVLRTQDIVQENLPDA